MYSFLCVLILFLSKPSYPKIIKNILLYLLTIFSWFCYYVFPFIPSGIYCESYILPPPNLVSALTTHLILPWAKSLGISVLNQKDSSVALCYVTSQQHVWKLSIPPTVSTSLSWALGQHPFRAFPPSHWPSSVSFVGSSSSQSLILGISQGSVLSCLLCVPLGDPSFIYSRVIP